MNINAILQTIILSLSAPLFAQCAGAFLQKSELPAEMPAETEITYRENGGMARSYKQIKISGKMLFIKKLTFNDRDPKSFYAEITDAEMTGLYRVFKENKFDLVKNDKRTAIVYDAPSEGIYIRAGRESKNVSYGKNSPLSGTNLRRYRNVKDAITRLEAKYKDNLKQITDNYAVIEYDAERHGFIYKTARPLELNETDFALIDSITRRAVDKYNSGQDDEMKISDLARYNFQYLPVYAENGQKEVWVNAFCSSFDFDWKKKIVLVDDGGKCFFNLKINLSDANYRDFQVNGVA